jgi:hypothetical protein
MPESSGSERIKGDSGGGLITKNSLVTNDRQVLLGVLSEGTSCTELVVYGKTGPTRSQIFTSVIAHTQEIEDFIELE